MSEVLEEHFMQKYIFSPIKCVYGLVQALCCWFKEYINTMTLKAVFNQCNTNTCLLYRVDELRTDNFSYT